MTTTAEAFCPTCQREVYLSQDQPLACPVCSSTLVAQELKDVDLGAGTT